MNNAVSAPFGIASGTRITERTIPVGTLESCELKRRLCALSSLVMRLRPYLLRRQQLSRVNVQPSKSTLHLLEINGAVTVDIQFVK